MEDHYYVRTDEYKEILHRKKVGCFEVPMIHSAILVDLRKVNVPSFRPTNDSVPEDDIILFATSAKERGIPLEICNELEYGALMSPLDEKDDLMRDDEQLTNLRIEIAGKAMYIHVIVS
jgi:collagen beta-1,O-galactosyltransferase